MRCLATILHRAVELNLRNCWKFHLPPHHRFQLLQCQNCKRWPTICLSSNNYLHNTPRLLGKAYMDLLWQVNGYKKQFAIRLLNPVAISKHNEIESQRLNNFQTVWKSKTKNFRVVVWSIWGIYAQSTACEESFNH